MCEKYQELKTLCSFLQTFDTGTFSYYSDRSVKEKKLRSAILKQIAFNSEHALPMMDSSDEELNNLVVPPVEIAG